MKRKPWTCTVCKPAKERRSQGGFTLLETIAGIAILSIIAIVAVKILGSSPLFFQRVQAKSQMNNEARTAMAIMTQWLRKGNPSTVQICSCNNDRCSGGTAACVPQANDPPNSQIDFVTGDGHSCAFWWRSDQSLMMDDSSRSTQLSRKVLATHVTGVSFSGDPRDPTLIGVSLRLDTPYAVTQGSTYTLFIPNQFVRMGGKP